MRDFTGIIEEFREKPVSKFRELCWCARQILHAVILGDLEGPLGTPPDTVITKGRHKKDPSKRDKSHWERI